MLNVLLDDLPKDWKGYRIDTDFQTGIMISQCLCDQHLSEWEKFYTAARLLFRDSFPGTNEEIAEAINWYMTEYNHDNRVKDDRPDIAVMDWDVDQWRIYAAFYSQYSIDLNTAKLHWFAFMGLLANLSECAFTHVMEIRQKKISSKMSPEEKAAIKSAKKVFEIKPPEEELSAEEKQQIEEFMKYAGIEPK